MKNFILNSFKTRIICENSTDDINIRTEYNDNKLRVFISAVNSRPKFVELKWNFKSEDDLLVLGDAWERSYGDLEFKKLIDNDRYMPWYFVATDKSDTYCLGVETQPNSFVSFTYKESGITALLDCRNGGSGVELNGREICLGVFIFKKYEKLDTFTAMKYFCKEMCPFPILPSSTIYGGNNWYYAYGKSSYDEIITDTKLQVELSNGIDNKPFMVIDDCWQINPCAGPWLPNEKFNDMKKLADDIKSVGARPGIWVRLLYNLDPSITDDMKIERDGKKEFLDPTNPKAIEQITADIKRIRNWGYEMLKHDFSTVDMFGNYGLDLSSTITKSDGWHFYDRSKTNAEIVIDFYTLIKEQCGDMLIIGCNTVSHLCAGLVQINRTGDDTSGKEWERTKKMGINTLAFRLCQNDTFYLADADCIGILDDNIQWEKNKQWLDLLANSNTALFISCNNKITNEQKQDIKKAYKLFQQSHTLIPIDIYENLTPEIWNVDGTNRNYQW